MPFGWGGVFYCGAMLTALLGITMLFVLPESLQFCLLHYAGESRTLLLMQRLAPGAIIPVPSVSAVQRRNQRRAFSSLFSDGRVLATPLLWSANFANMLCAYFLAAWVPILMNAPDALSNRAAMAGTMLWVGGLVGNLLLGVLTDRKGFAAVLVINFIMGGVAIAGISRFHISSHGAMLLIALAGFCVLGGQSGLNALAVAIYPTRARATGAGWASGIGRLGAILACRAKESVFAHARSVVCIHFDFRSVGLTAMMLQRSDEHLDDSVSVLESAA